MWKFRRKRLGAEEIRCGLYQKNEYCPKYFWEDCTHGRYNVRKLNENVQEGRREVEKEKKQKGEQDKD